MRLCTGTLLTCFYFDSLKTADILCVRSIGFCFVFGNGISCWESVASVLLIHGLISCVAPAGFAEPSSPTDAALALPCGAAGLRWADREPLSGWMERILVDFKLVLQSIVSQADDLQDRLVNA